MLAALREEAPDAETGDWQQLSLRRLNQRLLDQGLQSNPEMLRRLLASLARDGRGLASERGSLELRQSGRDHYRVRLHRDWRALSATAERRQALAGLVLQTLLAKLPEETPARGEILVSFGTDELTRAIAADWHLAHSIHDPLAAADLGLMFLHEQGALVLQKGLTVFRQAMTLRLLPQARGKRYSKAQHQPLAQHYGERIFQIHVMAEFALLARTRAVLEPIRALCEVEGIPVAWHQDLPPLHRVREIAAFLDTLREAGQRPFKEAQLVRLLPELPSVWRGLLERLVAAWSDEAGEAEVPAGRILEYCYETLAEQRRERSLGEGVLLSTLHGAKGLEFPHVLIADGDWRSDGASEEERRLYYVGMTRARETLTLGSMAGGLNPFTNSLAGDWLLRTRTRVEPTPEGIMARRYALLSPADMDLGYAARLTPQNPVHARLAALQTGDELGTRTERDRVLLIDSADVPVARLSAQACIDWLPRLDDILRIRVVALLRRSREDGSPRYRDGFRTQAWEVPLVEILWHGSGREGQE